MLVTSTQATSTPGVRFGSLFSLKKDIRYVFRVTARNISSPDEPFLWFGKMSKNFAKRNYVFSDPDDNTTQTFVYIPSEDIDGILLAVLMSKVQLNSRMVVTRIQFFTDIINDPYEITTNLIRSVDSVAVMSVDNGLLTATDALIVENLKARNFWSPDSSDILMSFGTDVTIHCQTIINDPVITLGYSSDVDDHNDRGIEFRYFKSTAKTGFMGFNSSDEEFVLLTDATKDSDDIFSGNRGGLQVGTLHATDIYAYGNAIVEGELTVNSTAVFSSDVTINGDLLTEGELTVNGNAVFSSDVTINGDLLTEGELTVNSNAVFSSDVTIHGDLSVDLTVTATTIKQYNPAGEPTSYNLIPAGVIFPCAMSTAPSGYLLCNGQSVSRTTYSELFSAISTTYGVGDGSTTFGLPDLRGKMAIGVSGSYTLGASGGSATTTLSTSNLPSFTYSGTTVADGNHDHGGTLTTTTNGSHTHTINDSGHNHTYNLARDDNNGSNIPGQYPPGDSFDNDYRYSNPTSTNTTGITINAGGSHSHDVTIGSSGNHTHGFSVNYSGTNSAFSTISPYFALNYIIKY